MGGLALGGVDALFARRVDVVFLGGGNDHDESFRHVVRIGDPVFVLLVDVDPEDVFAIMLPGYDRKVPAPSDSVSDGHRGFGCFGGNGLCGAERLLYSGT